MDLRPIIAAALIVAAPFASAATLPASRSEIQAHFEEALARTERLESVGVQLTIMEEAGVALRFASKARCDQLFATVYKAIVAGPRASADSGTDREDLFRRLVRIVARYDPSLAAEYANRYSREYKPVASTYLWGAAYDLLMDDRVGSIRLATQAAKDSATGFPDEALLYLEHLRLLDPVAADSLASMIVSRIAALPPNARLALLTYVVPHRRIPEMVGDSLSDKYISGRPDVLNIPGNPGLVSRYVAASLANPSSSPNSQLLVLRLVEERLRVSFPSLAAQVQRAESEIVQSVPDSISDSISKQVARWSAGRDLLEQSTEDAETAFLSSQNEKLRNRAVLLRALSLAQRGDYATALALVSELPSEVRGEASNAVLLYAADGLDDYDQARRLSVIARSETHNEFVSAFSLLTVARVGSERRPPVDKQELTALLAEVAQLSSRVNDPAGRFALRLGCATLWVRLDKTRAFQDLTSILRDMDSDLSATGDPVVRLTMRVSGTMMQYNIRAGRSNLYNFIRTLAREDIHTALASVSVAAREDVRLRGVIAACSEYLRAAAKRTS